MDVPRRSFAFVGAAMAIAMVAGPIAIASRAKDDGALVKFVATETGSHTSDRAPKGLSPGDTFRMTQDVALAGGRRVGTTEVDCGYLKVGSTGGRGAAAPRVESVTVRCKGLLSLPDGTVEFTGRNTFTPGSPTSSRFDLISGTGSYAGVAGELIADEQGHGRTTLWLDRVIVEGDRDVRNSR